MFVSEEDHEEELGFQLYNFYLDNKHDPFNLIAVSGVWMKIAQKAIQYVKENMNEN